MNLLGLYIPTCCRFCGGGTIELTLPDASVMKIWQKGAQGTVA